MVCGPRTQPRQVENAKVGLAAVLGPGGVCAVTILSTSDLATGRDRLIFKASGI
jgi:hypothetical protein